MKIFIYSDLHISKTSSILPMVSVQPKYTYRQNMIIETGKYLANIIDEVQPDLIINLGDTFDQHTISSYDVDVASEFFKCFRYLSIPHLVLVGNHEMVNYDFNAIEILNNINNITVISEPCTVNANLITNTQTDLQLALMPYMEHKDILELPKGQFLFSHLDIAGIKVRGDYELQDGVQIQQLSDYKLVFNGHIHKPSIKGNVINVGSISTHSFSDDNDSLPQCYLLDTDTLDMKVYKPIICPLFRKYEIKVGLEELKHYVSSLDESYKYILQVICPFDIKEDVKKYLKENNKILNSRLSVRVDEAIHSEENTKVEVQTNVDIKKSFREFLDTVELKYPVELYEKVLGEIK